MKSRIEVTKSSNTVKYKVDNLIMGTVNVSYMLEGSAWELTVKSDEGSIALSGDNRVHITGNVPLCKLITALHEIDEQFGTGYCSLVDSNLTRNGIRVVNK